MVLIQKTGIIDILISSFSHNERILSMLGPSKERALYWFFNYVYEVVQSVGDFFVTKCGSNVILYYQNSRKKHNLKSTLALFRLVLNSNIYKLWATMSFNKQVGKIRNQEARSNSESDFIYVWFLAGNNSSEGYVGLTDIKEYISNLSTTARLSIYMETTIPRMLPIYRRAGFEFYNKEVINNTTIWFGKYNYNGK